MLDDLPLLPTGKPSEIEPKKSKDKRLYVVIPFRAFHDKKLTHRQLIALGIVCSYADKRGNLWPGVKKLARDMGITHQTMSAHVRKLTERGYLKTINERYKPGEQAQKRAVIYDLSNPVSEETWLEQEHEKIDKTDQTVNNNSAALPETINRQDLQAVFKVWKAAVNKRYPGTPVTYNEKDLKLLARHPLENIKKIVPQAVESCRSAPSSCRLLLRFLKK